MEYSDFSVFRAMFTTVKEAVTTYLSNYIVLENLNFN